MTKNLHIVITIDLYRHWQFFCRFIPALRQLGHQVTILTPMPSVYLQARAVADACLMLRTHCRSSLNDFSKHDVVSGKLTEKAARRLTDIYYQFLNAVHDKNSIDQIWLWNGASCAGVATSYFRRRNRIQTRYFELANIPGKIFVDSEGVNALSGLYNHPEKLDYQHDAKAFQEWREGYLAEKLQKHDVKQSYKYKKIFWSQIIDMIFSMLGLVQLAARIDLKATFQSKRLAPLEIEHYKHSPEQKPFSLFPLQVKSDTQLTINSDITNIEALKIAVSLCADSGQRLLVKLHPAERDKAFIEDVLQQSSKLGFEIVDGNTFEIIKDADRVIVINSTVGLEALILGKPVIFLGRSIFSYFDSVKLANYIIDYLHNIDFFGHAPIDIGDTIRVVSLPQRQAQECDSKQNH